MKSFVFPGNIEPEILAIGSQDVPYARTSTFGDIVLSCERDLLRLTECRRGRVIPFTASGTAGMEAVVANLLGQNDRVLVLNGGSFGQRWVDLIKLYPHGHLDIYHWDLAPDGDALESMIKAGDYHFVFMQHHETSTGSLLDITRISMACRDVGALCVVDAIGSFLADPFSMARMKVDIAVLSSQKGLCLPPGLSFVVMNELALTAHHYSRGLYFDFKKNLDSLDRGQPLFSPAVQLFLQLRERLNRVGSADDVITQVATKARFFRECLARDDREMIPQTASNCLTSFRVKMDARNLCDQLARDGWYIMPSGESDQIRVSHIGLISELDHSELYERICALEKSF